MVQEQKEGRSRHQKAREGLMPLVGVKLSLSQCLLAARRFLFYYFFMPLSIECCQSRETTFQALPPVNVCSRDGQRRAPQGKKSTLKQKKVDLPRFLLALLAVDRSFFCTAVFALLVDRIQLDHTVRVCLLIPSARGSTLPHGVTR